MTAGKNRDMEALGKAKIYMGDFAWPTVVLGLSLIHI